MAHVIFYEKPGCAGNKRQKAMLAEAGHTVEPRDLLTAPWTADSLRAFFGDLAPSQWFNRAAPAIKNGEIDPDAVTADKALDLMLAQPLLIRRPLMQVGEDRLCGFEAEKVAAWIGLGPDAPQGKLEGCVRPDMPPCPPPAS
ncbi:MAG TPA: ArsC/Spx/MgsR family protein [Azospirillaceae bacterium]|nr:ArsC/Spx/MgsR family protein [Azospirillaceae bacterium]HRQ80668.1 ArsC/Spx/MgsR family protein [Azospirillaceae bacterium]